MRSLVRGMAVARSRERWRGKGGFAGICFLYGRIFGTGTSVVPDSALRGGHGGIWGFQKLSPSGLAVVRQIVGYGVDWSRS